MVTTTAWTLALDVSKACCMLGLTARIEGTKEATSGMKNPKAHASRTATVSSPLSILSEAVEARASKRKAMVTSERRNPKRHAGTAKRSAWQATTEITAVLVAPNIQSGLGLGDHIGLGCA